MEYFVRTDASGAVDSWGNCPDGLAAMQMPPDGGATTVVDRETYEAVGMQPEGWRLLDGELVERAAMAPEISAASFAADGVAECVISGLPDPCMVTVRGAVSAGPVEVTGGSLTLTSTAAGEIRISVTADPAWKPWRGTVEALA